MAKFKVTLTTVLSYTVEVEADDEDTAIEVAYGMAPREAYGPNPQTQYTLDVNETWQLNEPEVEEID